MSDRGAHTDGTLRLIPDDIEIGERLGFYHEIKAIALGRLIAVDGQRTPISVVRQGPRAKKPWKLVAGRHRLEGIRLEQIPFVIAIEVTGKPEDLADHEASENLHRRPLPPVERAIFVHALCEAAQLRLARQFGDLNHHQIGMKQRWAKVKAGEARAESALQEETEDSADKMSALYGWQGEAAEALGLDKRTIRRSLELYRLIVEPFPDLAEALAKHPIVGENASQLRLVAEVRDEGQRRAVIQAILASPAVSVEIARVEVGIDQDKGRAPTKEEKFVGTITDTWERLSISAKREYLPTFVQSLTPDLKARLRQLLAD